MAESDFGVDTVDEASDKVSIDVGHMSIGTMCADWLSVEACCEAENVLCR